MKCSGNHLRICKVKEINGEIVKPDRCEVFHIVVESCSQRRYYILNASNCFCVELNNLCNETYCVYEEGDCENDVTYEVDGVASNRACVDFNDQDFHHITVINHETPPVCSGRLSIKKRVFDACGKEIRSRDSFTVEVMGDDFSTTVVLSPSNRHQYTIDDIPMGSYVVSELGSEDYDVTYVVNGVESPYGNVEVDSDDTYMEILNRMNDGTHVLRICKWIRRDGRLVKPNYQDSYDITISDGYACREYTLNCQNHFCTSVEGNKNDTFFLQELDAQNVEYEVDGEIVDEVNVTMNQDHDVRIINIEGHSGSGMIVIHKWLEENGRLLIPGRDEVFYVRIQGLSEELFELNFANNFTMIFFDVEPGYYNVYEESGEIYDVSYEVNGVPQEDGYIYVEEDGEAFVNIINHVGSQDTGSIRIMKRVTGSCGCEEEIPYEGEFEIYMEGPDGGDYYMLDQSNGYELDFDLTPGWYTIYEINPTCSVTYRLDGEVCRNEVRFYCEDTQHELVIVNHINRVNYVI